MKISKVKRWFHGPDFLWQRQESWDLFDDTAVADLEDDDPEIKKDNTVKVNFISTNSDILTCLEERISSWSKMKRVFAYVLKFIKLLSIKIKTQRSVSGNQDDVINFNALSVGIIEESGRSLIKMV